MGIRHPKGKIITSNKAKNNKRVIEFYEKDLLRINPGNDFETRSDGEFCDKSIFLSQYFNWQIVIDSNGATVVVATKK